MDDSHAFNFLTRIALTDSGLNCEIDEVLEGQSALRYIAESAECPDIILLDINMPVMDGLQFLEEFEKIASPNHGPVKIVMLTTSINPIDIEKANKGKFVSQFLNKPLTQAHLETI